jgi:adenine-specific DNA methylase
LGATNQGFLRLNNKTINKNLKNIVMKNLKNTLIVTVLAAILLTSSAMTGFAAESPKTNISANGVNKIWVAGNVKLVLTQSSKEGVFVDEDFDAEKTTVERSGQTLYINSIADGQVTINISVKDLQRIQAAGGSVVETVGNFDVKYLQLFLSQSAKAKIKSTVGSLYTVITDDAVLKMNGTSVEHTLIASNMNNVKINNFASLKTINLSPGLAMNTDKIK